MKIIINQYLFVYHGTEIKVYTPSLKKILQVFSKFMKKMREF